MTPLSARAAALAALFTVTLHAPLALARASCTQETVTVTTDIYGVRHVSAATDEGAFFGAGYSVARDRLFHMMWTRVILEGRVASYFGAGINGGDENIVSDRKARTFGWARHAAAESAHLQANEPALYELLDAFADGVNDVRLDVLNGPPDGRALFDANGMTAELSVAWTPADSIGVWTRFVRNFQGVPFGEAKTLYQVKAPSAHRRNAAHLVSDYKKVSEIASVKLFEPWSRNQHWEFRVSPG